MRRIHPLVALALLAACRPSGSPGGTIAVEWRGADRGGFTAPLVATHCRETGLVELIAVRGDTGVGGVLYLEAPDRVPAGDYQVVPGSAVTEPRPGASAALRWFGTVTIIAWEGLAGTIRLDTGDSLLAGSIDVKLQGLDRADTLRLTGTFSQVALVPADTGCGRTMRRNRL